jgi:hypothetical protein
MTGDSPWLPRGQREQRRKRAPATYWWWAYNGVVALTFLGVGFVLFQDPSAFDTWMPLLLVAVAVHVVGALVMFGALPVSSRRRERLVRRARPDHGVVTMRTIAPTESALDRLAAARNEPELHLGRTYAVSIGPEFLELWGNPSRLPLVIRYRDILSATIGAQTVDVDRRGGRGVEYPGSVEFELAGADGGTILLPLVPHSASIASLNDDRVEYFVEQLDRQTPLPWVDAETPPDP